MQLFPKHKENVLRLGGIVSYLNFWPVKQMILFLAFALSSTLLWLKGSLINWYTSVYIFRPPEIPILKTPDLGCLWYKFSLQIGIVFIILGGGFNHWGHQNRNNT